MPVTDPTVQQDNQLLSEQIYDLLMAEIEPELLLANIPALDIRYANETPEEHGVRMQRYAEAYKKFDIALQRFKEDVTGRVRGAKRASLQEEEAEGRGGEEKNMKVIEEEMGGTGGRQ